MASENISYKEIQGKENSSYASALRSTPQNSMSKISSVPKKRRITPFVPNMSEDLMRTHKDIISTPSTSHMRGVCLNNRTDDRNTIFKSKDEINMVEFIVHTISELVKKN